MRKIFVSLIVVLSTACMQAGTCNDNCTDNAFDFERYHQKMLEQAENNLNYMKSLDEIRFVDYALIDIDNDGTPEVWVRGDDGQDYQGVYAVTPQGEVILLTSSDARSELSFYPGAVMSGGYYGDGEFREFVTTLIGSKPDVECSKYQKINNYSPDMEVLEEYYNIDGQSVTNAEYDAFIVRLGEPLKTKVEWHTVK